MPTTRHAISRLAPHEHEHGACERYARALFIAHIGIELKAASTAPGDRLSVIDEHSPAAISRRYEPTQCLRVRLRTE
jgi:hypothetical protein